MSRTAEPAAAVSTPSGGVLAAVRGHDAGPWRAPALLVGAAVACVITLALATIPAMTAPSTRASAPPRGLEGQVGGGPVDLTATASSASATSEHGFWPVRRNGSLLAQGGGIHSAFTADGALLRVVEGTLGLSLAELERGHGVERVTAPVPSTAAGRVLYRYGPVTEFYRSGPSGVEQGFTLPRRPLPGSGSLVLALRLGGSLIPEQVGSQILFRTHSGTTALRYGQLSATDASGRQLPAHMQVRDGALQLRIDDRNAHYPLWIDPLIQGDSARAVIDSAEPLTDPVGQLSLLSPATVAAGGEEPQVITISPDGKNLYVCNRGSNNISVYSREVTTGRLTKIQTLGPPGATEIYGIVIAPNGEYAYAAAQESTNIYWFAREANGELEERGAVAGGEENHALTISADGRFLYAPSYNNNAIYEYQLEANGEPKALSEAKVTGVEKPHIVVLSPGNEEYAYTADGLGGEAKVTMLKRNKNNGKLTVEATYGVGRGGEYAEALAISPDGKSVYVTDAGTNHAAGYFSTFARNTSNGTLNLLSIIELGIEPKGVVVSPDGQDVYITDQGEAGINEFSRNTVTGELSELSPGFIEPGEGSSGSSWLVVSPNGKYIYTSMRGSKPGKVAQFLRAGVAPPRVESVTPTRGPSVGGAAVVIEGKGFRAGSRVTIGSATSDVEVISSTEIKARTPAGSGAPEVVVTNENGISTEGPTYTYISPPPGGSSAPSPPGGSSAPSPLAASFSWFPAAPHVGQSVSLVSTSTDAASAITAFAWALTGNGVFHAGGPLLTTSFSTAGGHVVRLRVTDANGVSSVATRTIQVSSAPLILMQPFPIVRFAGGETSLGVHLRLLTVQAPVGARVTVRCRGRACPAKSVARVAASHKRGAGTVVVEFRQFERSLRAGVVLEVRVSKPGEIGKFTRFAVRHGKLPERFDTCLGAAGISPLACPSS
jgi:6-phosphogluconolactonase (cycloisomerase 2 family)